MYSKKAELSDEQYQRAKAYLHIPDYLDKIRHVDAMEDPEYAQRYCLHTFIPAPGATPNKRGLFGWVKFRGAFATEADAAERAEYIIREVDSVNANYTSLIGKPFPLAEDVRNFVKDVSEVELDRDITKDYAENMRKQKRSDEKKVKEIKDREKELLADVNTPEEKRDPLDVYIEAQVKRAQLRWTHHENTRKLNEYRQSILRATEVINQMDAEDASYKEEYMARYEAARAAAGLGEMGQENWMQFMLKDLEDGF